MSNEISVDITGVDSPYYLYGIPRMARIKLSEGDRSVEIELPLPIGEDDLEMIEKLCEMYGIENRRMQDENIKE